MTSGRNAATASRTAAASVTSSARRSALCTSASRPNSRAIAAPSSPRTPVTRTRIISGEGGRDGVDDLTLLRLAQLAVDRQRQRLRGGRFGRGKVAALVG